jgi:hypothetical protein
MIIVSGSSWASGEWGKRDIQHPGLSWFIAEDGTPVLNLSQPGASGFGFVPPLRNFLNCNLSLECKKIIVFESDYLNYYWDHVKSQSQDAIQFTKNLTNGIDHFISVLQSHFYNDLSRLGQKYNIPIVVVGAHSDTIWIDKFSIEYPMVSIGCQSFVNLMLANNPKIDVPVHTLVHTHEHVAAIESIKKNLSTAENEKFLDYIDLGLEREKIVNTNELFFSHKHPNKKGHEILFRHLKANSII